MGTDSSKIGSVKKDLTKVKNNLDQTNSNIADHNNRMEIIYKTTNKTKERMEKLKDKVKQLETGTRPKEPKIVTEKVEKQMEQTTAKEPPKSWAGIAKGGSSTVTNEAGTFRSWDIREKYKIPKVVPSDKGSSTSLAMSSLASSKSSLAQKDDEDNLENRNLGEAR